MRTFFRSVLLMAGLITQANAQTVLISPTGDGGFETGATFAANSWTVVNNASATADNWVLGTGAAGYTGARAAYITNNNALPVPPFAYNNAVANAVHMYRDVTFPAGETSISFSLSYLQTGESGYDRVLVYISNAAPGAAPVLGTPASSSTALTGYTLLATVPQATTWTSLSIPVTAAQAGNATVASPRRLLFVWQSDNSVGGPASGAVDNISLITQCITAVSGLTQTAAGTNTATVSWNAVAGATGYTVRYKLPTDPITVPTWATPTATATNSLAITGLAASTTYEFQVSATGPVCNVFTTSGTFTTACAGPTVVTTTPGVRCGTGTVSLSATGSAGSTLKWYAAPVGGAALGSGSPFVTPVITTTTPYYVAATTTGAPVTGTIGTAVTLTSATTQPTAFCNRWSGYTMQTIYTAAELNAAGLTAGNITSMAFNIATLGDAAFNNNYVIKIAHTALTTAPTTFVTTGFTTVFGPVTYTHAASGIHTFTFTTPFNWDGVSNIIVDVRHDGANAINNSQTYYTATTSAMTVTATSTTATTGTTSTQRLNTSFTGTSSCVGPRVLVNATINTAPAITISSPQGAGICTGGTATINVSSPNSGYTYSWTPGALTGSTIVVTPAASTTYTVVANDAGTGCTRSDTFRVNVSAQPGTPTLSPVTATICAGGTQVLTASPAGTSGTVLLLSEGFDAGLGAFTQTAGASNTAGAPYLFTTYANPSTLGFPAINSGYGTGHVSTNADGAGSGTITHSLLTTTGSYNTNGLASLSLSFRHFYQYYSGSTPAEQCLVEISSNNGGTWTTLNNYGGTSVGTTTSFALATFSLNAYLNVSQLKIRFQYLSNWGYYWAIDSVRLTGTGTVGGSGNINYTNVTGLYKDVALTQALSLTDTNKIVYASPATNQVYTVRTNSLGCLSAASNTSTITVNPAPSSAITFTGSTTFCQPSTLLLTAPAGTFTYQWRRNGIPIPGATGQTFAADSTGAYTVTVTNTTPCSSTTTVPVNIIANPAPPTAITASGTTSFCVGGSVTLSAPLPPAGTTYTYVWKDNGVAIAGQTGATLVVTTSRNVTVTVTNTTTTCSATTSPATVVTVGPPPPAIVTAAGPTTFCQGSSVKLRTSNAAGLTYQWSNASGPIPGATDSTYTTTVAGTFTVTIQAGGPTCQSTSLPTTVTVNPNPFAAITASGAPTTFCSGGNVVLTATPPGLNYQWLIGGAPTTPPGSGQTYTASATGTYTAVVTNPATGCFATSNGVAVTVNPLPVATISPSATTTICAGNSTTLTANTGTGLTYQWFNGASAITGATAATYSASTAGSYTVLVTNANGCFATSNATVIIVTPLPVTTTTPSGPVNLCTNDTLTIVGPTGTGYTYQWRIGATNAAGVSTVRDYKATTSGVYTVIVTANGCSATSAATTVTLLPLPIALLSPTAPTTGCDSVVLSSASTGVTYQWRYNGNNIIGANSATYSATASGNYSLRVTGTNGCSAATTGAGTAITINPSPNGTITYSSPLVFCQGGAVVLNTYSGANLSYQWLRDTTTIAGANTTSYITSQSGLYSVKVINTVTGCGKVSLPVIVRVNALPNPVIVYNSGLNELSTVQTFAQYQWYKNTQPQTGTEAYTRFYHPSSNGAYSVSVTDTNGCVNISQITFVNSVGIRNTGASAGVKVYPNPTSGVLHVESSVKVNLLLRDVTGKAVLKANDAEELNIGQLADGMYLLYITDMQGGLIRAEKVTKSTR